MTRYTPQANVLLIVRSSEELDAVATTYAKCGLGSRATVIRDYHAVHSYQYPGGLPLVLPATGEPDLFLELIAEQQEVGV